METKTAILFFLGVAVLFAGGLYWLKSAAGL